MDQIVSPLLISSGDTGALARGLTAGTDATQGGASICLLGIVSCSDIIISVSTIVGRFHISKMEYLRNLVSKCCMLLLTSILVVLLHPIKLKHA